MCPFARDNKEALRFHSYLCCSLPSSTSCCRDDELLVFFFFRAPRSKINHQNKATHLPALFLNFRLGESHKVGHSALDFLESFVFSLERSRFLERCVDRQPLSLQKVGPIGRKQMQRSMSPSSNKYSAAHRQGYSYTETVQPFISEIVGWAPITPMCS